MKRLRLVIDAQIPFMKGFAEKLGEVRYIPGADITAADVHDADALIVRTRTRCNRQLLEGSSVRFIATATIGFDHIDTDYLKEAGIAWTNCPGCNAASVAQYVKCSLLELAGHGCWHPGLEALSSVSDSPIAPGSFSKDIFGQLTIGIVGYGHVGKDVYKAMEDLGFGRILCCDPPLAEAEAAPAMPYVPLEVLAKECDVITFHTPLTRDPLPHPTYHLADDSFFHQLKPTAVVINSSRGEVVDNQALKAALQEGRVRAAVIDTWEGEPHIDSELLRLAFIGTPHIAGYSADGKANGTRMSLQAVAEFFGITDEDFSQVKAPVLPEGFEYDETLCNGRVMEALALYDPSRDTRELKLHPEGFEKQRGHYPLRREHRG